MTALVIFQQAIERNECKYKQEMNVNISNEFNFSVVHGAMNRSGSLAKLT